MDQSTPCLLFVAINRIQEKYSSISSAERTIKGYALLSQIFTEQHPQVHEIFLNNGIKLLTSAQNDPCFYLTLQNEKLELFEIHVRPESPHREVASFDSVNPLVVTVDKHSLDDIKHILENNVSVIGARAKEKTSFIGVIDDDNVKAIEKILTYTTDIGYRHHKGGTILHFAVKRKQDALVNLLLCHGASANAERGDGTTPLHLASKKGHVEIARSLLLHYANVSAKAPAKNLGVVTPLVLAVKNRHVEVCHELVLFGADINEELGDGSTLLEFATLDGVNLELTEIFLPVLDCFIQPGDGWEVYTEFSRESPDPNVIAFILNNHPNKNSERNRRAFSSVLSYCADEYREISGKMIEYGFAVDYDNIKDALPLLFGAVHKNLFEIARRIVHKIVDINELYHPQFYEPRELTLLHMAAAHAGKDIISLLLALGADVNAYCENDRRPIGDAVAAGNLTAVELLVKNGSNVDCATSYAPCNPKILEVLFLSGANLNYGFEDQDSPLSKAAYKGDMIVINLLLKYGVRIGSGYVSPDDILKEAIRGGHPRVFQFLLDYFFTDTDLIYCLNNVNSNFIRSRFGRYGDAIVCYLIKVEAADLNVSDRNLISTWHFEGKSSGEFWRECEAEVAEMKNALIGLTNVSFYNVLVGDINRLTNYARNYTFVKRMEAYDYADRFPIYGQIVKHQFRKGLLRATLLELSIEILDNLSPSFFKKLPKILKEQVLTNCSNQELLITAKKMPKSSDIFRNNAVFREFVA